MEVSSTMPYAWLAARLFCAPLKKSSGAATKNARSCEYIDVDCLWRRTVRGCVNSQIYSLFIVKTLNDKYI